MMPSGKGSPAGGVSRRDLNDAVDRKVMIMSQSEEVQTKVLNALYWDLERDLLRPKHMKHILRW